MKSLTYISDATARLSDAALFSLGAEAARLNALDGITGLLLYNGSRFAQTIQGTDEAIDALMMRLERDDRHSNLTVIESEAIKGLAYPSWDMKTLLVDSDPSIARAATMPDGQSDLGPYYTDLMLRALEAA